MQLHLHNRGSQPWAFQAALHTYLAVQDLHTLRVMGLEGRPYRERSSPGIGFRQPDTALAVAGEVDRIYPDAPPTLALHEPGRPLQISQRGFADTVVWNPGPVRSAAISDLGPQGYLHMLCIEAASIVQPVTLAAGEDWTGTQRLQLG
jgi:glucose-6-phosphate 1-epimerase